ncbi:flagellar hook-length control protein FliK [Shewanella algae]|uniref:flagellar hook-length control protein FliK n=1 Tax=Shewanella algae TaxID=38313 RepID=UPI001F0ACAEB|nr:flagellar hook-length control protein FliK [Shewanella algae]
MLLPALVETPAKKVSLPAHPDNSGKNGSYRHEEQSLSQAAQPSETTASDKNPKVQSAQAKEEQEKVSQVKRAQGQSGAADDADEILAAAASPQELSLPLTQQVVALGANPVLVAPLTPVSSQGSDYNNAAKPLGAMTTQRFGAALQTNPPLAGISRLPLENWLSGEGRGAGDKRIQSLLLSAAQPQGLTQTSSVSSEVKGNTFLPLGTMTQAATPSQQLTVNAAAQMAAWHSDPSTKPVAELGRLQPEVVALASERPAVSQWGPLPLSAQASQVQHARELLLPLRDQLRFQIDQRIQAAELQLTPPELGRIELNIRLDGDRLHIQMHAVNNHVRDALLSGLERLRSELAMEHKGNISLDVATDSDRRQPEQDAREGYAGAIASPLVEELSSDNEAERRRDLQLNLLA